MVASTASDDKARRRLIGQVGTAHALEDVRDLVAILTVRDALTMIVNRLPAQIRNLSELATRKREISARILRWDCGPIPWSTAY